MDIQSLAAVLTIIVMGGTILAVSNRFYDNHKNSFWFMIGVSLLFLAIAIFLVVYPFPKVRLYWLGPLVGVFEAFIAGGLLSWTITKHYVFRPSTSSADPKHEPDHSD